MIRDNSRFALIPFAIAILLGAFLIFQVQPIISKCVLAWFGGTPAVWTTCMLFFQVLLFGGYLYAHFLTHWFAPKQQALIHGVLIAVALLALPIQPTDVWKPTVSEEPIFFLLGLLLVHVGLPYFVLSSTGPLVQAWLSLQTNDKGVYRLYALSNVGSLVALLSYPFCVEPTMSVASQSLAWTLMFVVYAGVQGWLLATLFQSTITKNVEIVESESAAPTWNTRLAWGGLAAFASMMLLAITNHVCQDIAVIPFLWVLPLSLYLVSFIICFDRPTWYLPKSYGALLLVILISHKLFGSTAFLSTLPMEIAYYMAVLFLICMLSHGEVARLKPETRHLTQYYAFMSGGGAVGGVFVGFVCPQIFNTYFELTAGFCIAWAIAFVIFSSYPGWSSREISLPRLSKFSTLATFIVLVSLTLGASRKSSDKVINKRSFFGVLQVIQTEKGPHLVHGRTLHGYQPMAPNDRLPTCYYGYQSGVGRLLSSRNDRPIKVGVVGLGIGTLANYGKAGDEYEFIEINPDCIALAQTWFTCLSGSEADVTVTQGDGRLVLERNDSTYDILVLDAFSSDGIPAHLLSVEALNLFESKLAKGGAIAIHTTNLHLNVAPVVHRLAQEVGLISREVVAPGDKATHSQDSQWVLISRSEAIFDHEKLHSAAKPDPATVNAAPLWTDQYHDLFSILKF